MSQETGKTGETSPVLNNVAHSSSQRRLGMTGVLPRRGGRKKTLSLNPEEREALENLIEEVIIDGGMGDSESASSEEEDGPQDPAKDKLDATQSPTTTEIGNDPKALAFKMSKKFYPGQLKVALKHMTDLPPRFSRKLKKAEKYLEMSSVQKKTSVSTSIKEEEEEEVLSFNNSNPSTMVQDCKMSPVSPKQLQNDKVKTPKEKTQKDLKKTIRSLLTDLDQYVDEKDRTSISLDLPGAVSCADLERETLGYSVKTPESAALTSPGVDTSNAKVDTLANTPMNNSPNSEKPKNISNLAKSSNHFVQPSTPKSFTAPVSSIYISSLPPESVSSKMSAVENSKHNTTSADKSAFHQYSNLAPSNFIDGNSIIMPVQSILPQIDFSVPPPSTFQYPTQYGMPSSQDNFMQGKVQFQPQFGFMELPAASAQARAGGNFVGTAPIIFQQYNTLPIASQTQQVQSLQYANAPGGGYFVGRFNCPRAMNYAPPPPPQPSFPTSPPHHMSADSVLKASMDRHGQNSTAASQKQQQSNSNSGNFRTHFRAKSNTGHLLSSVKMDASNSRIKQRNVRSDHSYYARQEVVKHIPTYREASNLKAHAISSEVLVELANSSSPQGIPQTSILALGETSEVPQSTTKLDQDSILPMIVRPISPLPNPPSNVEKVEEESLPDGTILSSKHAMVDPFEMESSSNQDFVSKQGTTCDLSKSSGGSICDSSNSLNEFLTTADIDLRMDKSGRTAEGGLTGLNVVLGEQFVKKLHEMFVDDNSVRSRSSFEPVFLSTSVLHEIFRSLPSSSSSLASTNNFEL